MKENPNIDELLNGFIDGELTARQLTEVQRLIAHDARIAQRLLGLQKCKMLVGSLPRAEAPAGMAEQIKTSLERRTLLGQQQGRFDEREGARHLLVRKVIAAAAMIGLAAILAATVYTIVAPQSGPEKPIVSEDWRPDIGGAGEVGAGKLRPSVVATDEKSIAETSLPLPATSGGMEFNGRLELKTSALIAVDAFINRAIEDNGLSDRISSKVEGDKSVYTLSCSREAVGLLLADLESIWQRFDSARLFVQTSRLGERVVVEAVSPEQIAEVVNQDSLKSRIEVAKDFAVLNDMAEFLPGKEVLAAIDGKGENLARQWRVPKPVLTSAVRRPEESEKTIKKPAGRAGEKVQVHLTIVVVGSESSLN